MLHRWADAVMETIEQNRNEPCRRWMRHARAAARLVDVPGAVEDLFAGWLSADAEMAAGAELDDALRVGWSVVACLENMTSAPGQRSPFELACLHLRSCGLADLLEAERFCRRRVRPRRRHYTAR